MNNAQIIGRATKNIEIRYTPGDNPLAVARFTIAVDRRGKREEQKADFISCIAFGKTAELLDQYVKKGDRIGVVGHIQTGSYTNKEGAKVYTTDVVVEQIDFLQARTESAGPAPDEGFMNIPEGIDKEIPFN